MSFMVFFIVTVYVIEFDFQKSVNKTPSTVLAQYNISDEAKSIIENSINDTIEGKSLELNKEEFKLNDVVINAINDMKLGRDFH